VWIREAKDDLIVLSNVNFAIDRAFRRDGVVMPVPQREIRTRAAS
jgi:small-conductance mechanosensitive channel